VEVVTVSDLIIDGPIGTGEGEVSAAFVRSQLAAADPLETLTVRIHSEGGSVFEGFAIYDALQAYQGAKRCVIASSAFSISSFIPMAFDDIEITPNGYLMLHNPYVEVEGDDEELASKSQLLSGLKQNMVEAYAARTGKTTEEITAILKKETFLSARQALADGFVTRISATPVTGRVFAKLNNMPHGVVAALFGAGSGGENVEPTKENSMSDSKPVAATLQEIKAAFPKSKSDFIVKCLEQSLPMASVAQAAVEEMMSENQELMAKVSAMEQELAKYKSMEVVEEEEPAAMEMEEEEEEMAKAPVAKRRGLKPVAVPRKSNAVTAKNRWDDAVEQNLAKYKGDRTKAVMAANKSNPGLREQMLAEINAR
jgi:ATP-dependent protease ClpP protease subunit